MTKGKRCLILAAGNGRRIRSISGGLPKPLVPFHGKPILEHVILRTYQAGIDRFVIVVGYRSDLIRRWFDSRRLDNVSVTWVENPEYHKHNGISVLKAREEINEKFLLLMADHVFEPETAKALMKQPLAPGEVTPAEDPNVDRIVALAEATKVRREGVLGLLFVSYVSRRAGPAKLLESVGALGWGLILVVALGGVSHLVKTSAWRLTLLDEKRQVSFVRMLGLRLASESVGQLGAFGQVFGESLRVSLLSSTLPIASGVASVTLDRALFIVSAAMVSAAGLIAVLVVLPLPHALSLYAVLFALTLLGIILVAALAVRKRWA